MFLGPEVIGDEGNQLARPVGYLPGGGGFETLLGKAEDGRLQQQAAGFAGMGRLDRGLMEPL